MADQLDLFSASRTTSYRNTHPTVTRRLKTRGSGQARVRQVINRKTGKQSLRLNPGALSGKVMGKRFRLTSASRPRGSKLRKASTGKSSG